MFAAARTESPRTLSIIDPKIREARKAGWDDAIDAFRSGRLTRDDVRKWDAVYAKARARMEATQHVNA